MPSLKRTCLILTLGLALLPAAGPANAATIDVGYHTIQPQPHQAIPIYVTGDEMVLGMSLYAQIPGRTNSPVFDASPQKIVEQSIWAQSEIWTGYIDPYKLYLGVNTAIGGDPIRANGLLATLYVDASGLGQGLHRLQLRNDAEEAATNFATVQPEITDGWIAVAPEPSSMTLLALGAWVAFRPRRSRT